MARTNYSYEKRGRELEKQKKQEQKRQKKMSKKDDAEIREIETIMSPFVKTNTKFNFIPFIYATC